ncbi:MAG: cyclic nucleotide-binding domain-containing protein [Actinomycetota bacterium]|nr:cyclic nucleotide-binding domain-containing protein [Actinomycetota bacterium]
MNSTAKKERREVVATLAALPLFQETPADELEELVAAGRVVSLPAGWTMIATDTPADSVYVLLSGTTVVKRGEAVIAEVGAGAVVGEAALIDGRLRNATVSAATPVRVLRVGYDEMTDLLARRPALRQRVYAGYAQRHLSGDIPAD